ncbi:hypothetical protein BGZ60DRAFT_435932 [Tricladium varicosporioides]|nr:hypothetical protein BGZ60DRAFT_435932 [Hymenoscyphus varicosporioides]
MQFHIFALAPYFLAALSAMAMSDIPLKATNGTDPIPKGNAITVLHSDVINTALSQTDAEGFSCILHCGAVVLASACIIGAIDRGQFSIAKLCLKGDEAEDSGTDMHRTGP